MSENEIARVVVDAAVHVHEAIGPGLLESVYEIGLLLNFGAALMKDGITRVVNGLHEEGR